MCVSLSLLTTRLARPGVANLGLYVYVTARVLSGPSSWLVVKKKGESEGEGECECKYECE